jgi:hypothetical protein
MDVKFRNRQIKLNKLDPSKVNYYPNQSHNSNHTQKLRVPIFAQCSHIIELFLGTYLRGSLLGFPPQKIQLSLLTVLGNHS